MAKKTEVVNAEFQIVETTLVPATTETKGVQLFKPENKEQVIQAFINAASLSFSVTPEQCKKLVKESSKLTIKDKEDKEGFKKVYDKHREFVKVRTGTEKERKVLTDPFNQIKSGIDTVAKNDILGMTAKEEERLKNMVDQWKEWEQEEADRIEKEAKDALDARVKELEEAGLNFDGNFYSCGETISVDVRTIQDFTEESFLDFKNRVSSENEKIQEIERIKNLHNSRTGELKVYWSFLTEEQTQMNFGLLSLDDFDTIIISASEAKNEFEAEKTRQEEEKVNQANERKALNYEKRSFKLEKEGFEIHPNGDVSFGAKLIYTKSDLEIHTNEKFEESLNYLLERKKQIEDEAKTAEEDKKKADEAKAKTEKENLRKKILLNAGFEEVENGFQAFDIFILNHMAFQYEEDRFLSEVKRLTKVIADKQAEKDQEAEKEKEAERLQKLPEIEKASNYIDSVSKLEIPALKQAEINEVLSEFKNSLKVATEKALLRLEKLK